MTLRFITTLHGACLCLLATGAQAAGPTSTPMQTTVIDNPGGGTNRIEVTGNTARNITVQCGDGAQAAPGRARANAGDSTINSVDIDRRALQGRTVIVTGRNVEGTDLRVDCADGAAPAANVNSVNIR